MICNTEICNKNKSVNINIKYKVCLEPIYECWIFFWGFTFIRWHSIHDSKIWIFHRLHYSQILMKHTVEFCIALQRGKKIKKAFSCSKLKNMCIIVTLFFVLECILNLWVLSSIWISSLYLFSNKRYWITIVQVKSNRIAIFFYLLSNKYETITSNKKFIVSWI